MTKKEQERDKTDAPTLREVSLLDKSLSIFFCFLILGIFFSLNFISAFNFPPKDNECNITNISDLQDVSITSPLDNDVLTFDNSTGFWRNEPSANGSCAYNDFSDGSVIFSYGGDLAEDNSNFFWDNTDKKLRVGPEAVLDGLPLDRVYLTDENGYNSDMAWVVSGGGWGVFDFAKCRGSLSSPSAVGTGPFERLGQIKFRGYDGVDYGSISAQFEIDTEAEGNVSENKVPANIKFMTSENTAYPFVRMKIHSWGDIIVGNAGNAYEYTAVSTDDNSTHFDVSGNIYALDRSNLGSDLVTNGDFDTDTDWTKGTGWSIHDGKAYKTSGSESSLSQSISLQEGKFYEVTFTAKRTSSDGYLYVKLGGTSSFGASSHYGLIYRRTIRAGSGSNIEVIATSDYEGYVDSLSVKEIQGGDIYAMGNLSDGTNSLTIANIKDVYDKRVDNWTAPLQFSSNTASITQASATTDGYLSSTDWNTFNNKQNAGNYFDLDSDTMDDIDDGTTYVKTHNDFTDTYKGYLNQGVKTTDSPSFVGAEIGEITGVTNLSSANSALTLKTGNTDKVLNVYSQWDSTSSVWGAGLFLGSYYQNSGNIDYFYSTDFECRADDGAGDIGEAGALFIAPIWLQDDYTGSVTSANGIRIRTPTRESSSTGTVGTVTGIKIDAQKQSFVTTGYGIYQRGSDDLNYFAGKVGIGTDNPRSDLEIQNTSSQVRLLLTGGDDTTGQDAVYGWRNEQTNYDWSFKMDASDNDKLKLINDGGTPVITFQDDGKVGIGTDSPTQLLDVESSSGAAMLFKSTGADAAVFVDSATGHTANIRLKENGNDKWVISNDGTDSDKLKIATTKNGNMFTIDSDGKIGIGTTSPTRDVSIVNSADSASLNIRGTGTNKRGQLVLEAVNTVSGNSVGDIYFMGWDSASSYTPFANIKGVSTDITDGSESARLELNVYDTGVYKNVVNILSSRRVGIGTTSPSALLTLKSTADSSAGGFKIEDKDTSHTPVMIWQAYDKGYIQLRNANVAKVYLTTSGNSYLLDSNLGIGTSSPSYDLDVNGDTRVSGQIYIPNMDTSANEPNVIYEPSTGKLMYYSGGAVCPFFQIYDKDHLIEETEFSKNLNSSEIASWQTIHLDNYDTSKFSFKIKEKKPETSYIDVVQIVLFGSFADNKTGELRYYVLEPNLKELKQKDGEMLILNKGDEREVKFDKIPDGFVVYSASLRTYGYYKTYKNE